jgi:His-Xaa-Ser system protein HxsD
MEGARERTAQPQIFSLGDSVVSVEVDTSLYNLEAVFKAAYHFTDRCYIFLARTPESPELVSVTLMAKKVIADIRALVGEFCNELVDHQIRLTLSREVGPLRELIVAQAFAEGNLLDAQRDEGDYEGDPLGIGDRR